MILRHKACSETCLGLLVQTDWAISCYLLGSVTRGLPILFFSSNLNSASSSLPRGKATDFHSERFRFKPGLGSSLLIVFLYCSQTIQVNALKYAIVSWNNNQNSDWLQVGLPGFDFRLEQECSSTPARPGRICDPPEILREGDQNHKVTSYLDQMIWLIRRVAMPPHSVYLHDSVVN
jgi:hypothetical protein